MTGIELDVLRMLRVFGPCSNAEVGRRLGIGADKTYGAIKRLVAGGYAEHLKLQAWEITEKGRKVFDSQGGKKLVLFEE